MLAALRACRISRPVFQVAPHMATLCNLTASTPLSHWTSNRDNASDHIVAPTIPKPFAYRHLSAGNKHWLQQFVRIEWLVDLSIAHGTWPRLAAGRGARWTLQAPHEQPTKVWS